MSCIPQIQSLEEEVMNSITKGNCKGNLWGSSVINGNRNWALAATLRVLLLQKETQFSNDCSTRDTVCLIHSSVIRRGVSQQHGGPLPLHHHVCYTPTRFAEQVLATWTPKEQQTQRRGVHEARQLHCFLTAAFFPACHLLCFLPSLPPRKVQFWQRTSAQPVLPALAGRWK